MIRYGIKGYINGIELTILISKPPIPNQRIVLFVSNCNPNAISTNITMSGEPKAKPSLLTIVDCNITSKVRISVPIISVTIIEGVWG